MKNIFSLLLLSPILFLTISCSEDGAPENVKVNKQLIDLEITKSWATRGDLWLIATDASGEVLDYKRWKEEAHLVLTGDVFPDEKINILILFGRPGEGWAQELSIYSAVSPERKWMIGNVGGEWPDVLGSCSITWDNLPQTIDNSVPRIEGTQGYYPVGFAGSGSNLSIQGNYSLLNSPEEHMFACVGNVEEPSYFETDTLQPGKDYSYDYQSAFTPFENVVELKAPAKASYHVWCYGIKNDKLFTQASDGFQYTSSYNFGYRSGYDQYVGSVVQTRSNVSYLWNVVKPSLTSADFSFPIVDFTITNESFDDFSYTLQWNKNFVYHLSVWYTAWMENEQQTIARVNVYGNQRAGSQVIDKLPEEILSLYPRLTELKSFQYLESSFRFSDVETSYEESIDYMFDNTPKKYDPKTYYEITKWK